jgi:CRISPR system Cascade subunit CasA
VEIAGLIIDAPGEQTKKLNIDHFIKRDIIRGLCPACTAQALLTLQLNAPAGGAGHRTSLRGGGPLSTFVLADPRTSLLPHADALWTQVWLNVLATNEWPIQAGEAPPSHWLPWALPTATSEQNETVTPMDAHALTVFWATPRRIRLDLENLESGPCDLCGETTDQRIVRYRTRPRGANYVQWEHPHTPHRRSKPTDEWLPVHPQPGGLGYRHWPALVSPGELSKPARVVAMQLKPLGERAKLERQSQLRLWAFGYDLDNAKARSYQEAVMPLLDVDDPKTRKALDERARAMVEAAGGARNMLRGALKDAWFGEKGEARGDFGFVEREFWSTGEEAFFQLLETFAKDLAAGGDAVELMQALALHWQQHLLALAVKLFDHWALYGEPEMGNPRRIMDARARLMGILGSAKFLSQLGGAAGDQPGRPRTVKGAEK